MKSFLFWLGFNAVLVTTVWFGFVEGLEGPAHLAKFFIWGVMLPLAFLANIEGVVCSVAAKPERPAFYKVSRLVLLAAVGVLAWGGHFLSAGALLLYLFLVLLFEFRVREIRAQQ